MIICFLSKFLIDDLFIVLFKFCICFIDVNWVIWVIYVVEFWFEFGFKLFNWVDKIFKKEFLLKFWFEVVIFVFFEVVVVFVLVFELFVVFNVLVFIVVLLVFVVVFFKYWFIFVVEILDKLFIFYVWKFKLLL